MKVKFLLFMITSLALLLSCVNNNQEKKTNDIAQNPFINIELVNVSIIKIKEGGNEFEIKDRKVLESILSLLKNSQIKYIKFGSKNVFTIYDTNQNVLIEGLYKDDIFKVKGIAYQTTRSLFK